MIDPLEQRIRLLVRDLMGMAPDPADVSSGWPAGAPRRRSIPAWLIMLAGAMVAVIAVGLPLLLVGKGEDSRGQATTTTGWQLTESQEKAAEVGIFVHPPAEGGSGNLPAPIPYLGVERLSNYLGLDAAVVPETAVVTRDGRDVVFVVVSELFYSERYIPVEVEARPVALRERIGRGLVVEEGLTGCDIVIVAPPEDLKDGDAVRSFADDPVEGGVEIDYQRLFPGIDPADFALSGGFLRPGISPGSVFVIVHQREGVEIPPGSTLIFQPPNGPQRLFTLTHGFPKARGLEFEMLTEELVRGERVGSVRVISPSGTVIALGKLSWWCPTGDASTAGTSGTSGNALAADLRIEGTRPPYTFDETQAFGEFGPLLWGLVTTISGTDEIPHGPGYEWVDWGPLWAGRQPDPGPYDVYGVTDLSAIDVDAIAAVVPFGTTIVLREVAWSLDQLEEFKESLNAGAPDNAVCSTGSGLIPNRVHVVATTPGPDLGDVPPEAVAIEIVDQCGVYVPAGTTFP